MLEFEKELLGKKVFITGHTGFTGSWVCLWLKSIGIDFAGFSLPPGTVPSLYAEAVDCKDVLSIYGDICDYSELQAAMTAYKPDLVLHLAAQPLVRKSFREPIRTFSVNALGTAHVLECVRSVPSVKGVLCITTDKVYKNNEWAWPYRETDPLGGKDPYSASKSAAEMIIGSYMDIYSNEGNIKLTVARGGNIVGGGDWSEDRLIPDYVRAVTNKKTLSIRNPEAIRPWQHVLALVHGYLLILAKMLSGTSSQKNCIWNLGPHEADAFSVMNILDLMDNSWASPKADIKRSELPEAQALMLDSSRARSELHWYPAWDTKKSIEETAVWYRDYYSAPESVRDITIKQIQSWRMEIGK